jgi:peptidoglycan/LPS O-acetylase OafA/YrhL
MSADSVKQWEVQSSTGKHFDVLDGLRGVAILMVVVFHTFYVNPGSGIALQAFGKIIQTGWMGVPIFFVLSGFLISYPFFRGRAADNNFWYQSGYARRRIGKILPPYYLSIAILVLYYLLRSSDPAFLHAAWQWALGLPNFFQSDVPFNISYWSLIVEVHFYILLPVLFWLTRGLKPGITAVLLFGILFLVPLIVRHLTWPEVAASRATISFLMNRFPTALDFFGWGILFAGLFVSLSGDRGELRTLGLLGQVGLLLMAATVGFYAFWSYTFDIHQHPVRWSLEVFHILPSVATFFMLFLVFNPDDMVSRLLAHPALRFIGLVSYEWFLLHMPFVSLSHDLFGSTDGNFTKYLLKTILPLVLSFGLSVLLYRYFSLPLMNRIRGRQPTRAKQ